MGIGLSDLEASNAGPFNIAAPVPNYISNVPSHVDIVSTQRLVTNRLSLTYLVALQDALLPSLPPTPGKSISSFV
jgi:hypothetical protein